MKRYAGRLLFQFRRDRKGSSNARRLCEERIVVVEARSAPDALRTMRARGRAEETDYEQEGEHVFFEFVGVAELIELGAPLEPDEVWWEFYEVLRPMERRNELIPTREDLRAFSVGRERAKRRRAARRERTRR
jgi:hypothetical protein